MAYGFWSDADLFTHLMPGGTGTEKLQAGGKGLTFKQYLNVLPFSLNIYP